MKLFKIDSKNYQYILIYWMIALIGSNLIYMLGAERTYAISAVFFVGALCFNKIAWRMERDYLRCILTFTILCFITMCFTMGDLSLGTTFGIVTKLLIIYATVKIDPENFSIRFVKTIVFLAVVSLILWAGYMALGSRFSAPLTRLMYHNSKENTYGLFLLGFNFSVRGFPRNAYIFGEPGKYQIVLNGALFFLFFSCDELSTKEKRLYTCILVAAIITAMSTEGYFILLLIIIGYMLSSKRDTRLIKGVIAAVIVLIVYLAFFGKGLNPIELTVTDKIFTGEGKLNLNQNSSSARVNGIMWYPEFVFNNFWRAFIGVGASSADYGSAMGGILGFFFTFGILNSGILYGYMIYNGWITRHSTICFVIALTTLVLHGLSQPDTLSTITCLMLLYSGVNKKECLKQEDRYETL